MSLAEVARLAAVSPSTVSRVINRDSRISTATARRVMAAIERTGYQPAPPTDGRRRRATERMGQRTGRLAVLFPDTDPAAMRTVLSGRLLHGLEGAAQEAGLTVILASLPREGTLPGCIDLRQIDGVIVRGGIGGWLRDRLVNIPSIGLFFRSPRGDFDSVAPDDATVGRLAAEHLLERGRRRLLVWDLNPDHEAYRERVTHFVQTCQDHGASVTRLHAGPFTPGAWTDELAAKITPTLSDPPDGLFVPSEMPQTVRAQQCADAIRQAGGPDLEVVGCGHDEEMLRLLRHRPTHLDIQPEKIGAAAVELLLWRLANPEEAVRKILIAPRLTPAAPAAVDA